jgi:HAD superfamily hydrolase (TIGR01509 family)
MLNSTFQPAFKGGDMCRVSRSASAIQSALHSNRAEPAYLAPNSQSMQKTYRGEVRIGAFFNQKYVEPINKGAILTESTTVSQTRERFMKQKANKHNTKQRPRSMSEIKLKAKGIFFDLDGTIVDSREAYIEAARIAFQAIGQKTPPAKTALEIPRRLEQNQPINDIIKADIPRFLDVYLRTYYSISAEKTKPIPGIATTLETLSKKAKLALITMRSVPKDAITAELEHFGIAKHFTHIVTAQDTHKPKPSPEALIKTVKALDIQMCDCIIIGDSINDIKAGKNAGAKTIAVLTGLYTHQELANEKPNLILKNATKLPNHIQ